MFQYLSRGLPSVWLKNGYTIHQTDYGEGVTIDNVEDLHNAIGLDVARNNAELTGEEFRFLRKELDMPQVQLAKILGVSESSLRGWENGRSKISPPADRMLRILYVQHVQGDNVIQDLITRLSQINRESFRDERREMEETPDGWRATA